MEALGNNEYDPTKNYNVILMKHFMLVVMRGMEGYKDPENHVSLGVNSMGYAGSFAVKNHESLELLKKLTPTKLL
jgi:ATP adenylyltransferase/5',5'''-P-1,P-4-tetraphosphate phosphorylase II